MASMERPETHAEEVADLRVTQNTRPNNEETVIPNVFDLAPDANVSKEAAEVSGPPDVEASAAAPPEPPIHSVFSRKTKALIVFMTAFGSLFSPISGQIYLPSLNTLAAQYKVSDSAINYSVTTYMILQGLAPIFFGDLADQIGRRPVYIMSFTIYFFANLGLALQRNFVALLILRALQSTGSSGTIALGNGVIADIATSAERGSYIAWVQMGTLLGPALGPILGGLLSQFLGWPSIFWFLLIGCGVYLILYVPLIPETGRNIVGDGSIPPQGWNRSLINILQSRREKKEGLTRTVSREEKRRAAKELAKTRKRRFPNPFNALRIIVEKDVSVILFTISMMMLCFFCVLVPIPSLFEEIYGFNDVQIGLCYIPFSSGALIGSIVSGRFIDYNYRRIARKIGVPVDRKRTSDLRHFPIERARLEVVWYPLVFGSGMVIIWGWVLRLRPSLAAPLVVIFFCGLSLSCVISMLTSLLVDLYPQRPATATAALNVCRCLLSAVGTSVIEYIINAWGLGWTYTFMGLLMMSPAPFLWATLRWGPKWREERYVRQERKDAEKAKKKEAEKERTEIKNTHQTGTPEKNEDASDRGNGKI